MSTFWRRFLARGEDPHRRRASRHSTRTPGRPGRAAVLTLTVLAAFTLALTLATTGGDWAHHAKCAPNIDQRLPPRGPVLNRPSSGTVNRAGKALQGAPPKFVGVSAPGWGHESDFRSRRCAAGAARSSTNGPMRVPSPNSPPNRRRHDMTAAHIIAAIAVPLGTLLGFFVARIAGATS